MSHAILSPSSASRWLVCTKSARLEAKYPNTTSPAAAEGTLAHRLSELIIGYKLKRVTKNEYGTILLDIVTDKLYDNAMFDYCDEFSAYVLEQYHAAQAHTSDALIFLEDKVDLTKYIEEGYGTVDIKIIADKVLTIIDLKYGKGVSVAADNNKQLMLYALGELEKVDFMYGIEKVVMTIYQPRIDNISSSEIYAIELRDWATKELIPKARLAFRGEGEFVAGTHCQFCKVRATCKANAAMQLDIAKHDFAEPVLLTDDEVADIIGKKKAFETWLGAVADHALHEAVNNGKKWPGYKLVSGKSFRVYTDENNVATKLMQNGFSEHIIYSKKLLGITAMEKLITKPKFTALLEDLIFKPSGAPTLAPESDKRDEIGSASAARKDFENEVNN